MARRNESTMTAFLTAVAFVAFTLLSLGPIALVAWIFTGDAQMPTSLYISGAIAGAAVLFGHYIRNKEGGKAGG